MKVTILGCGGSAGVPMIGGQEGGAYSGIWGECDPLEPKNYRTRSSIMIEKEGYRLLIDTGPDLRAQLLKSGFSACDAVLYTHAHSDHIAGLDELRAINRVVKKPLDLWAREEVLTELQKRFSYAFQEWDGEHFFRPVFEVHPIDSYHNIQIGPFDVVIFPQKHGRMTSMGMRFDDIAYCTDVDSFPEESFKKLEGVKIWIIGCFQREEHPAHASLKRVLEWYEMLKPERVFLTHMGIEMDYHTLCKELPPSIRPAWDGLILEN